MEFNILTSLDWNLGKIILTGWSIFRWSLHYFFNVIKNLIEDFFSLEARHFQPCRRRLLLLRWRVTDVWDELRLLAWSEIESSNFWLRRKFVSLLKEIQSWAKSTESPATSFANYCPPRRAKYKSYCSMNTLWDIFNCCHQFIPISIYMHPKERPSKKCPGALIEGKLNPKRLQNNMLRGT